MEFTLADPKKGFFNVFQEWSIYVPGMCIVHCAEKSDQKFTRWDSDWPHHSLEWEPFAFEGVAPFHHNLRRLHRSSDQDLPIIAKSSQERPLKEWCDDIITDGHGHNSSKPKISDLLTNRHVPPDLPLHCFSLIFIAWVIVHCLVPNCRKVKSNARENTRSTHSGH